MSLLVLVLVTFLIHVVWERSHIGLYRDYEQMNGVVPVPVFAAFGDIIYTLFAVFFIALFKGNILWFETATALDYVGFAFIGFGTSLFVEYKAMYFKRWAYTEHMPIVPFFETGLTSLAQKTLLFPLSLWLTMIILQLVRT